MKCPVCGRQAKPDAVQCECGYDKLNKHYLDATEVETKAYQADIKRQKMAYQKKLQAARKNRSPRPLKKPVPGECFRDILPDGRKGPLMMAVPAGKFQMGDVQGDGEADEKPVHELAIRAFAVGVSPVTFEEYAAYCHAIGCTLPDDNGWQRKSRPVINVSWFDALKYCDWLYDRTGRRYRLPTEAEWEYMARAGSETAYCFGDNPELLGEYAWFEDNADQRSQPVGRKKPNTFGICDVHGNVWEWTGSRYSPRYEGHETRHLGPESFAYRALRGGAWNQDARQLRASYRDGWIPTGCANVLGFRVVGVL